MMPLFGIFIWTLNPYDTIQFQGLVLSYAAYVTIHPDAHPDDRVDGRPDACGLQGCAGRCRRGAHLTLVEVRTREAGSEYTPGID